MNLRIWKFLARLVVPAVAIITVASIAACGGGSSSETPTPSASEAPTTTATAAPTSAGPLTLSIGSIEPDPASMGDTVTVTFITRPTAVIGLEVIDGGGNIVAQDQLTAGSNGSAVYSFDASGDAGTWTVSAAAGATVQDLLKLQASPVAGPNTADGQFEVQ